MSSEAMQHLLREWTSMVEPLSEAKYSKDAAWFCITQLAEIISDQDKQIQKLEEGEECVSTYLAKANEKLENKIGKLIDKIDELETARDSACGGGW